MSEKTFVIIGGGAAGFFCAVNAARMHPEAEVILLERTSKLLSKVKVSGGGRCNVTHACFDIVDMSKRYPRGGNFVKKAFHQFFTTDTIQWFEERGVKLKAEADGRMFPVTDSSQTIIDCLLREASIYGVKIRMNSEVKELKREGGRWELRLGNGEQVWADAVCIACGGFPKAGMFEWVTALGHTISEPVPSLFTFNMPGHPITALMGVVAEKVVVKIAGTRMQQEGPVLITHWGLSGPAILRLSAWGARELAERNWQFDIRVNWLPEIGEPELREMFQRMRFDHASQRIGGRNVFGLPQRLWEFFLQQAGIDLGSRWADLPVVKQNKLIMQLVATEFSVKGKTTFKEEFVTAGGISLVEVDPNSMASRKQPGLYFAGEILDVDGVTGGFNFQHAWTSGFIAAKCMGAA